jgi:hypothetical protein
MATQRAMSHIPVENIVSAYLGDCIRAIQQKHCNWCKDGQWRVVIILAMPLEGDEIAFTVKCGVQCYKCLALESKEWKFTPVVKQNIVTETTINE